MQADGFATATTTAVIAQAGSTTVEPAVSLVAPASMTVTLQDSTSTPIASVAVDLVQDGVVVAEGETDATGTVTLTGLAAGRYEVQTQAFPFLSPDAFVTAQSGASLTETYVLQAGGTIQGAVTDGSGQPLADVPVTVLSPDGTGLPAATASDGTYQFVGLDVGTYAVMIGTISGLERQEVSLGASDPNATVNFVVSGATLAGTVLGADGKTPLSVATVYLVIDGAPVVTALTDTNGDYSFEGVPPGTYTVQTDQQAGLASSPNVAVTTGNVAIPTIDAGNDPLAGTVKDPDGNAVAGATVLVVPGAFPNSLLGITAATAADGSFSVPGLAAGSYLVFADAAGLAIQEQTVTVSSTSPPLTLALQAGTTLGGTVSDARAEPP